MKVQTTHLSWYIVEQLPVVPYLKYEKVFGSHTGLELVKAYVLRLTYTADDMAPFAHDMGYVENNGTVKPPIIWNETERRHMRARLDALYFILYGVTDDDDIRYILSTFPIVERKDRAAFNGVYLTRELILWYKRALEAGDSDALAPEAESDSPRQDARGLARRGALSGIHVIRVKPALSGRAARPGERAAPAGFR